MGAIIRIDPRGTKARNKERATRLRKIWDWKAKSLGLTQEKAAQALGWETQGAVGHALAGRTPLTIDLVLAFADLLKCEPSEIVPELARPAGNGAANADTEVSSIRTIDLARAGRCWVVVNKALDEESVTLPYQKIEQIVDLIYSDATDDVTDADLLALAIKLVRLSL